MYGSDKAVECTVQMTYVAVKVLAGQVKWRKNDAKRTYKRKGIPLLRHLESLAARPEGWSYSKSCLHRFVVHVAWVGSREL